MNVIYLDKPKRGAKCKCCGGRPTQNISFKGPYADKTVSLDVCDGCGALLGRMLIDECADGRG